MYYSIQKLQVAKGAGAILIMLIAACTSEHHDTCHINGNEKYLKAPSLHALSIPSEIIMPTMQPGNYEIPAITRIGAVGKGLDICPPRIADSIAK